MANIQIKNDTTVLYAILALTAGNQVVAAPTGDTFTATSSDPAALAASISSIPNALPDGTPAGTPALDLVPLVQTETGITVTVSDADGLQVYSGSFDIVQDLTPTALTIDLGNPVVTPQAVPSALQTPAAGASLLSTTGSATAAASGAGQAIGAGTGGTATQEAAQAAAGGVSAINKTT